MERGEEMREREMETVGDEGHEEEVDGNRLEAEAWRDMAMPIVR